MTPEDRMLLDEALGRADAAEALVRAVFQMLGDMRIIPHDHLLEMLDAMMLVQDQTALRADARLDWQARQIELLRVDLAELPGWQRKPEPGNH